MKRNAAYVLSISLLLALPSCSWFGSKDEKDTGIPMPMSQEADEMAMAVTNPSDGSAILVTMAGEPLITQKMLEAEKQKLLASNPQLQAVISMMDEKQLNRNLIDGMASRAIIRKYIADNNIDTSDKYKQDMEMVLQQVKDALNTRYFMEAFTVSVSDAEVKKFYEENKNVIPNLLLSQGGVEAMGISFESEQAAKDFAAKVKEMKNDVTRAAKEAGLSDKVKDFKLVNEQSLGIDPDLRDKIVDISIAPSVDIFNVGNEYWVIAANKKEAASYRPLDQVKDELKQLIEKEKTMKLFEEEIARLKGNYKIEVDESFFASDNAGMQAFGDGEDADMIVAADSSDEQEPSQATVA